MSIISVKGITKEFKIQIREEGIKGQIKSLFVRKYQIKKAVESISFEVEEGDIVGYIGPNGAGKSTTIKMLVGILQPTDGKILINGMNPFEHRKEIAKVMGVVFGQRSQLWWDIPLRDSIQLMKYMYKIDKDVFEENLKYFSDVLDMEDFIDTPVRQLSLGQRMRAEVCVALLHNPRLLFLDEPTIGLDVVVKEKIRNAIKKINKERNVTIILTTHDMSDIAKLCNRVMVIDAGRVIYDGNLTDLITTYGSEEQMRFTLANQEKLPDEFLNELGVELLENKNSSYSIRYDRQTINSAEIIKNIDRLGYDIKEFCVDEMEIEEVIRKVYSIGTEV